MSAPTTDPDDAGTTALESFWADLHRSPLSSGPALLVPVGLAVGVAAILVLVGEGAALATAGVTTVLLVLAVWRIDRPRWQAQDVLYGYHALRGRRWRAETGDVSPVEQPGRAETWLAAHPRGSVAQIYRAIAAIHTRDPVLAARELDAVAAETPLDRARVAWLRTAVALERGENPDLGPLRTLVADLPAGSERAELEAYLAQAEAIKRHAAGDRGWLEPLVEVWPAMQHVRLPIRARARLWLVRLRGVAAFLLLSLILGSAAPAVFAERIPAAYAQTRLATRGEVPVHDGDAIAQALPAIARAVAGGTRAQPGPLDVAGQDDLIGSGLPTLIWEVGAIDIAGPADAPGRLWQVEVRAGARDGVVLLTFDSDTGPVYAYRIDPGAVAPVAEVLGVP